MFLAEFERNVVSLRSICDAGGRRRHDSSYTYYNKEGEDWVPDIINADKGYHVDGDRLALRWRPKAGAGCYYEMWDIDYKEWHDEVECPARE